MMLKLGLTFSVKLKLLSDLMSNFNHKFLVKVKLPESNVKLLYEFVCKILRTV